MHMRQMLGRRQGGGTQWPCSGMPRAYGSCTQTMMDPWQQLAAAGARPQPIPEVNIAVLRVCGLACACSVCADMPKVEPDPTSPPRFQVGLELEAATATSAAAASSAGGSDVDSSNAGADTGDSLSQVPRVHASELTYERFCLEFMEPNLPVLIEASSWEGGGSSAGTSTQRLL